MLTEEKRPHTSPFKGCLRGDRYKEPSNRLQAPYRANTKAVLTGVENKRELPPLVYVADNRATGLDILDAVNKAFEQYKRVFADKSDIIKGFTCPNDILDYNEQNPENPIAIVRVAYQHHDVVKPKQVTIFDTLAKGWLV